MKTDRLLEKFAKGKDKLRLKSVSKNAVIYTRISTKEQAENNQSLDIQRKYCLEYAIKNKFQVLGFFGGTYESARRSSNNWPLLRVQCTFKKSSPTDLFLHTIRRAIK